MKKLFLLLLILVGCTTETPKVEIPHDKLGIDISHYQGLDLWNHFRNDTLLITSKSGECVKFNIRKREKISFIYIKSSQGANFKDPLCFEHYKQARKHGIKDIGFYHFYSVNYTPEEQFKNFKAQLDRVKTTMPPAIDFEVVTFGCINRDNKDRVWRDFKKFYSLIIKEYGDCIVYVNYADYDTYPGLKNYKIWYQNPQINDPSIKIAQITVVRYGNLDLDFNYKTNGY